jgi:hypothetical protein
MSVRELPQSLDVLFLDAAPLLHDREYSPTLGVQLLPPTCNQSAICVFSRSTWVMRSLRTVTACAGERVVCALRERRREGRLGAAHQQCRVFFALKLHGAIVKNRRTATVKLLAVFT